MYSWAYPQELFPFSYPPVKFEEPQGEMNSFIPIRQDTTIKVQTEVKCEQEFQLRFEVPEKKKRKSQKVMKKEKQKIQDEEFQLNLLHQIREDEKKKIKQNKTRNFYSTIFRIFLRKSCNPKNKSLEEQTIQKIIQKFNLSVETAAVMKVLEQKNRLLKSYIKVKDIKKFFYPQDEELSQEKSEICKVLRILMQKYLKSEFFLHYWLSKNIRDGNQTLYFETCRKFQEIYLSV